MIEKQPGCEDCLFLCSLEAKNLVRTERIDDITERQLSRVALLFERESTVIDKDAELKEAENAANRDDFDDSPEADEFMIRLARADSEDDRVALILEMARANELAKIRKQLAVNKAILQRNHAQVYRNFTPDPADEEPRDVRAIERIQQDIDNAEEVAQTVQLSCNGVKNAWYQRTKNVCRSTANLTPRDRIGTGPRF